MDRARKFNRTRALLGAALVCSALLLTACNAVRTPAQGTVSRYSLYYLNADASSIRAIPYEGEETEDAAAQAGLFLEALAAPAPSLDVSAPITGFTVLSSTLEEGEALVDFSAEYSHLDPIREILVRAAVVSTLCQAEGVDRVRFLVAGEPLAAGGKPVGAMDPAMFIFNAGSELKNYETVRLHLYFASESGDSLINTYRTVFLNTNLSMERLVAEEVFKGPNSEVVFPTLNPATRILSVTCADGVCYIDLGADFLTDPYDVTPQVAVYSLVNSLCELPSVRSVQISVEGNVGASFMESISLTAPLEANGAVVAY